MDKSVQNLKGFFIFEDLAILKLLMAKFGFFNFFDQATLSLAFRRKCKNATTLERCECRKEELHVIPQ